MSIQVTNVKISCKIPYIDLEEAEKYAKESSFTSKRYPNFLVIRQKYTFILFKKSDK